MPNLASSIFCQTKVVLKKNEWIPDSYLLLVTNPLSVITIQSETANEKYEPNYVAIVIQNQTQVGLG